MRLFTWSVLYYKLIADLFIHINGTTSRGTSSTSIPDRATFLVGHSVWNILASVVLMLFMQMEIILFHLVVFLLHAVRAETYTRCCTANIPHDYTLLVDGGYDYDMMTSFKDYNTGN